MNHRERENIVNSTWGGNHINQPPIDDKDEKAEETCECTECKESMTFEDYDRNGGICYFCIMKI